MNNTLKVECEDEEFLPIFQRVADEVYLELEQSNPLSIEINFVQEEEIRELNKNFRNNDRITDVLSFPYLDGIRYKILSAKDYPDDLDDDGKTIVLGSVCICRNVAEAQAQEYGHSVEREVAYLGLHGILHCFGYDHMNEEDENEMTALAEKIMNKCNITRGGN